MAHVFERYFTNTLEVEITDRLCEAVLLTMVKEGPRAIADPANYQVRANIMWAGTVAHLRFFVLFDFADFLQNLVEFRSCAEFVKIEQQLAIGGVFKPAGECLGFIGLHGVGIADDHRLFRRKHRNGAAAFHNEPGDRRNVRVGGIHDLLGKRVVLAVSKGVSQELVDLLVLGKLVFADEGENHSLLEVDDFEAVLAPGGHDFDNFTLLFAHECGTHGALEADFAVHRIDAFGAYQLIDDFLLGSQILCGNSGAKADRVGVCVEFNDNCIRNLVFQLGNFQIDMSQHFLGGVVFSVFAQVALLAGFFHFIYNAGTFDLFEEGVTCSQLDGLYEDRVTYSSFGRRDPFVEVDGLVEEGINIDQVELVGIIWESDVPVAILVESKNPSISYTVKEGDKILNGKVLKITQTDVLFLIQEFGVSRRYSMGLPDKLGGQK